MKALSALSIILFVICVSTLLITTNLRLAVNEDRLYEYGFNKFDVGAKTGLDDTELHDFANQMIAYFNSGDVLFEPDPVTFTDRELEHLKDVKGLIKLAYYLQYASLTYVCLYVIGNFVVRRGAFWRDLAKRLFWGGGTTVALLAFFGLWATTDFDSLFLLFHLVGFRNDLWQLNPADNMLQMFPQGFFNEAALFVAAATILEAVIIGGSAWGIPRLRRNLRTDTAEVGSNKGDNERDGS
ncbi:TIGR01906 family membrane protein [Chloroflexota bacterium]